MIIAANQYGAGGSILTPIYDYTGTKPLFFQDDDGNWEMVFYGDCQIRFRRLLTDVDIFIVDGGRSGASGTGNLAEAVGGKGGDGGRVKTHTNKTLETGKWYTVTIGASDSSSSAFGFTTAGGEYRAGQNGAKHSTVSSERTAAVAGLDGFLAYGDGDSLHWTTRDGNGDIIPENCYKFGASGAGGSAFSTLGGNVAAAANGGKGWIKPGVGEQRSGGDGGDRSTGSKGTTNSGGGGGGGASEHYNTATENNYAGGKGGTGIVKMRNAR